MSTTKQLKPPASIPRVAAYEVVALSRKDGHLIHRMGHTEPFFPYEAHDYTRAREVMLGLRRMMPALSLPGCDAFLMVRQVVTS